MRAGLPRRMDPSSSPAVVPASKRSKREGLENPHQTTSSPALLWGGRVASDDDETSTVALREFNPYFINHPQLKAEVLSVGDGLGYAVKIA